MQGHLFPPKDHLDESPLARLWRSGTRSLCDAELVSMLLPGCTETAAQELAHKVLDGSGLVGLLGLEERIFLSQRGLAPRPAASVLAAVELGRRLADIRLPKRRLLECPDQVASYLWLHHHRRNQEVGGALYLDTRRRLIEVRELTRGTLREMVLEPRTFLQPALENGAQSMIMFHTHPSGEPSPSSADLAWTDRLAAASELVGIELLDHLILGSCKRFVSLRALGGAWSGAAGRSRSLSLMKPSRIQRRTRTEGRRILPETKTSIPGMQAGQEGAPPRC